MQAFLPIAIATPLALALLTLALPARLGRRLSLLGPATVAFVGAMLWRQGLDAPRRWSPASATLPVGGEVAFVVDRLGVFFLLLVGVVGLAIVQYARAYFGTKATKGFWALLQLFTGAMTGLVVSDNLVVFYVFWELTTVASALLVAGDGRSGEARRGAVQAFLVTGLGGLALLAGIVLLEVLSGVQDFSGLRGARESLLAEGRYAVPLALVLVGALAKSAQFPFHFWLPGAMAAPTPVSAYLHSATMVQAGIVLLARLAPAFGDAPLWLPLLSTLGLSTFVVAGFSALRSWDLKRLLASSTAAYLGLVVAYYGHAGRDGAPDGLLLIANHALYKSALFLLVGWIEKVTGTRDLRTLTPERWVQHVPFGAFLFGLGVLAMAGTPLLLGFASKEVFLTALLGRGAGLTRWGPLVAAVVGSGLAFGYGLKFGNVFFGREPAPLDRGHPKHEVSRWLVAIPALLLVPQVIGGIAPRLVASALQPGSLLEAGPAFWHHADTELVLSLGGYLLGAGLFTVWQPVARARGLPGVEAMAAALAKGTVRAGAWLGQTLQAGGHPRFLAAVLLLAMAAALARASTVVAPLEATSPGGPLLPWISAGLVLAGVASALGLRNRTSKVIALGMAGYGVALFYALFRAPDLVLTQTLVESLSLILVLSAFDRLPPLEPDRRAGPAKAFHAVLALLAGGGMGLLAWVGAGASAPRASGLAQLARALPEAHGRNAVNVILVDFRGADTLGEIAVLVTAALGGLVLLGLRPGDRLGPAPRSRILEGGATAMLPAILVFAAFLLLRGHDAPGGGFIAGLVVSFAFILHGLALGEPVAHWPSRRPLSALGVGPGLAAASASLALLLGRPFFTHAWAEGPKALEGVLSTAFLFDLGVFAAVVAATAVYASALSGSRP